jgi:probable HAF family extracellular repeat protein
MGADAQVAQREAVARVTVLGSLGGGPSRATAINDRGHVVGATSTTDGSSRAFLWSQRGRMTDLGRAGAVSAAVAIADNGQVVGESSPGAGVRRGFSWTRAGGLVEIGSGYVQVVGVSEHGHVVGTGGWGAPPMECGNRAFAWTAAGGMVSGGHIAPGRCPGSRATAVNDGGTVVGTAPSGYGSEQAFVWYPRPFGGGYRLPSLDYYGPTSAADISNTGHIVGWGQSPARTRHAVVWTASGEIVDLGTLGGADSAALAVSDTGQVIGTSQTADGSEHGFSWTAEGGMVDLGPLGAYGRPTAVNECGQVVGHSFTEAGGSRAFLWSSATGRVDLTLRAGAAGAAAAINDRGQIVGWSETMSGEPIAVLWKIRGCSQQDDA